MFYFYIDVSRAGEPVNFLAASAPARDFFFQAAPDPDFFSQTAPAAVIFFWSGSGSSSKWPNKLRLLASGEVWKNILFPAN